MRFTGICLLTDDVAALRGFYEKALRAESDGMDIHTDIFVDGAGFSIYSAEAAKRDMAMAAGSGAGKMTLSFQVENVDAEYERLKEIGVVFLNLPTTYPWGSRSMQFYDPDGNIVSFFMRV